MRFCRKTILVFVASAMAAPVLAAGGRIEISQAGVEAAGGFPYEIAASGNYVLTSDLIVTEEVAAVSITASRGSITIDLNGFRIEGPHSCTTGSCPQGSASGIGVGAPFVFAAITVVNGDVAGFSGDCIQVSLQGRVEGVRVTNCGRDGITAGAGSHVFRNNVSVTGEHGIEMAAVDGGAFAHNTVRTAGLAGSDDMAIFGGRATAGNSCDDGSCSAIPKRHYYLTPTGFTGAEALQACAAGFHTASLWEIFQTATLDYDLGLGVVLSSWDQGEGPPTELAGWTRTGAEHNAFPFAPGRSNCDGWKSDSASDNGTMVALVRSWGLGDSWAIPPWEPYQVSCDSLVQVWCVED